jgi:hypothetical protein
MREDRLYDHRPWPDEQAQNRVEDRQTASLAGVVIILVVLVLGLFLVQQLGTATKIEDCLLAGRRNCDALVTGSN